MHRLACLALTLALLGPLTATAAEKHEIHQAVSKGDVERARTLLADDPSLRTRRDGSGRTPFHWAVMKPDPELWSLTMTPELLNEPDGLRLRPVFLAITNQKPDALDWLIEQGADLESPKPSDRQAPLHWAAEQGRSAQVRSLLAAGVPADPTNAVGSTPLLIAAKLGHEECVGLLLEGGAGPDRKNMVGLTPLMFAASRGHLAIVELLLDRGADPTLRDGRGKTALDHAQDRERDEVVEVLRRALP